MKKRSKSKGFIGNNIPAVIPAAKLPDNVAMQLTPMQAEILTRVMNDSANHRIADLLESHGEMADPMMHGLISGSGVREKFSAEQMVAVYGLMKLSFLWGVRAEQEDWAERYRVNGK